MHDLEANSAGKSNLPEDRNERARDPNLDSVGAPGNRPRGIGGLWLGSLLVLTIVLAALVPTVGDLGITWDEPVYRQSQVMSAQWWEQLRGVRSGRDLQYVLDPSTLLYFWPYGRFGINFHPPLAGQLNLATHAIFGHWMKDIPARRMASVIEFAVAITIGFQFLARRYGVWAGLVTAGSLLSMPRLYGQAHLVDTDTPGLLLWAATALAFWKGVHEPHARRWRVAVGILIGLAFVEKMGAVMVLLPLLIWTILGRLPATFVRPGGRAAWIDGICTMGALLAPLALAFQQILTLQQQLPRPDYADLFIHRPASDWPGAILAIPLAIWFLRRLLGRFSPNHPVWGVERPALETWTAILAYGPVVGWLGNPAWWRETLPRLAHYYTLNRLREVVLPKIQVIYFGQIYEYSLPWHNAWVLIGITVPLAILVAAVIGLIWAILRIGWDRLPLYFLIHFLTLPAIRMMETPAHDGVRLLLPTFFFLAAFAGWGAVWLAEALARLSRLPAGFMQLAMTVIVLGSAATALARIHPYELSYYNELIGGPRGAWERGFELTYWYDAFNPKVIDEINRKLPADAEVSFLNPKTETSAQVFQQLQDLGALRGDILVGWRRDDQYPYVWLLTQDSKASAFTRLLFAMRPWYTSEPRQLDGARVASVADPVTVARAWALQLLLDAPDPRKFDPPAAPQWVRAYVLPLARFWGDGLVRSRRLTLNHRVLDWSRSDPDGLLAAAQTVAAKRPLEANRDAQRLMELLPIEITRNGERIPNEAVRKLLQVRPEALVEAVQMINAHRDEIVRVMTRYGYTDPRTIGGYLDRDLPNPNIQGGG